MIPAGGVHDGAGERFFLHQVGHHRLSEHPDRRDDDVEGVLVTGRRLQPPGVVLWLPACRHDLGVQHQMVGQPVTVRAPLEVLQDLRLPGPQARPLWVEVERVRVQVRFHVAGQARVGVDAPRSADAVFAVEDGEVVETGLAQKDSQRQAPGTGSDDAYRQVLRHAVVIQSAGSAHRRR